MMILDINEDVDSDSSYNYIASDVSLNFNYWCCIFRGLRKNAADTAGKK